MATHHYVIKGADPKSAADGSKPTPIRREIDEWWFSSKKEDVLQQTLMVRALQKFMAADPSNDLSYFGIAGMQELYYSQVKRVDTDLTMWLCRNPWAASQAMGQRDGQGGEVDLVLHSRFDSVSPL